MRFKEPHFRLNYFKTPAFSISTYFKELLGNLEELKNVRLIKNIEERNELVAYELKAIFHIYKKEVIT